MDRQAILAEVRYKASRSSGPGGQHVNKTASKVTLEFDLPGSEGFSEEEKTRLMEKLGGRLTKHGILQIHCEEHRSQHRNREIAASRLLDLLRDALRVKKKRKPTKPRAAAVEKRLKDKRQKSEKKKKRQKPDTD